MLTFGLALFCLGYRFHLAAVHLFNIVRKFRRGHGRSSSCKLLSNRALAWLLLPALLGLIVLGHFNLLKTPNVVLPLVVRQIHQR